MCVCVSVGYLIPLILCYISTFPSFSKHLEEASIYLDSIGKENKFCYTEFEYRLELNA